MVKVTETFSSFDECTNKMFPFPETQTTPSANTNRLQTKKAQLSRDEILSILQDVEIGGSFLEYMIDHGVISSKYSDEILKLENKNLQRERLLDLVYSDYDTSRNFSRDAKLALLMNALRSTGQHALASQLDCGRKIKPAPTVRRHLNDTGYDSDIDVAVDPSSSLRRRGQLDLWVQVAAIRLSPASCHKLLPASPLSAGTPKGTSSGSKHKGPGKVSRYARSKKGVSNGWQSSTDNGGIKETLTFAKDNPLQNIIETSNGAYFWIDLKSSILPTEAIKTVPWLHCKKRSQRQKVSRCYAISRILSCFCFLNGQRVDTSHGEDLNTDESLDDEPSSGVQHHLENGGTSSPLLDSKAALKLRVEGPRCPEQQSEEEALRLAKLAILDAKSNEFYQSLATHLSDSLVKFFEQEMGVLVLGARIESECPSPSFHRPAGLLQSNSAATAISIVVTTSKVLQSLNDAVTLSPQQETHLLPSSKLSASLERIFQSDTGFLERIGVKDLRLSVALHSDEIQLAASELDE